VPSANPQNPAGSGGYEELAAIARDPSMRRAAWRLAGDMADDLLQEAWYAMARTAARESIENPRGYFYKTMLNTWRHLRQDLARHGIPADDLDAAAGAAKGLPSAEHEALARLDAAARRGRLRARRAELWPTIPPYSPDPYRYRGVVITVAEAVAAGDGPVSRVELNKVLVEAYPEWFGEPGVAPSTFRESKRRPSESAAVCV